MSKYVAFLRAINVGGHTVKMEVLRKLFASLGFANVESFIASGNIVFDTRAGDVSKIERRIEKQLANALGYEVTTFVRSTAETMAIAEFDPFVGSRKDRDSSILFIGFLKNTPSPVAMKTLLGKATEMDQFRLNARELYWLRRGSFGESEFSGAVLEKLLGMPITLRNVTTVKRLAAKYAASD